MSLGQVIMHGTVEINTATVNVHELLVPCASVAVHVTTFVPIGNVDPDGGEHDAPAPLQLSETIGDGNVTTAEVAPPVKVVETFEGHVINKLHANSNAPMSLPSPPVALGTNRLSTRRGRPRWSVAPLPARP